MRTARPDYRFYATLLDAFTAYQKRDVSYDKYYAWSENPEYTPEEWDAKMFQELIDRINRVPFDSEAADKGTAFNEVVDALIENRKPRGVEVERSADNAAYVVTYNNRAFTFPIALCREFSAYYQGALTQQRVSATLPTAFGEVEVYGVIDELMPTSAHDIKTTGSYTVGKFKDHWQHVVYPYCLTMNGCDIRMFEYNVAEFNKSGYVTGTYTETYVFDPDRDIPLLQRQCEELIRFLNDNRDLITDKKIFGGENDGE